MRKIISFNGKKITFRRIWYMMTLVWLGLRSIPVRLFYANNAGFYNNFGAYRQLNRFQRSLSSEQDLKKNENDIVKMQATSLQQKGYLLLPAAQNRSFLLNLLDKVLKLIEDPVNSYKNRENSRHILHPIKKIPELAIFLSEHICHIITTYYGCAFRIDSIELWRNYHVENINANTTDVFSNTFHHDPYPVLGLRVFVLLTDGVTRETGSFRFHEKSISKRIIRSPRYLHRHLITKGMLKKLTSPSTLQYFEGNIGDICIVNTQECLHAASVPREGSYRDILQFEIYPISGPIKMSKDLFLDIPSTKTFLEKNKTFKKQTKMFLKQKSDAI